jgi:hypothetical protein
MPRPSWSAHAETAVLREIGLQRGRANNAALAERLHLTWRRVCAATARLLSRGLVERSDVARYRLTADGRALLVVLRRSQSGTAGDTGQQDLLRPLPDTLKQRAWTAMRLVQRFTVPEILTLAARPDERDAWDNLTGYLKHLLAAGYVAVLPARTRGTGSQSKTVRVYVLLRRDSEIAPTYVRRHRALREGDSGKLVPCG